MRHGEYFCLSNAAEQRGHRYDNSDGMALHCTANSLLSVKAICFLIGQDVRTHCRLASVLERRLGFGVLASVRLSTDQDSGRSKVRLSMQHIIRHRFVLGLRTREQLHQLSSLIAFTLRSRSKSQKSHHTISHCTAACTIALSFAV